MADQIRLQDAKEKVLEAGKTAQKTKEEAKTAFDNDEFKSDDQKLHQWVAQNYLQLPASYNEYQSAAAAYTAALQQVDPSAAREWQQGQQEAHAKLMASEDVFESTYYIRLPEE